MRVAIVNDLSMAVEILRRVIVTVPGYELAWVAYDGAQAVEKCAGDRPDLILMDLIMPVMDGVQATCAIMKRSPCPILVVTATVSGNAAKVFEAMGCGALDAVCTPTVTSGGVFRGAADLIQKMETIRRLIGKDIPVVGSDRGARAEKPSGVPPLLVIGASTGGPKALATILSGLPSPLGAAVVVIQHLDQQFAAGLADWLNEQTALSVKVAQEGARPSENLILVAATNDHLVLGADRALHYTLEPRDYPYRPSVDAFFSSVSRHWPRKDLAVLLTGMGRDGASGLLALRRTGWHTIVQNEETCVVYGMPRAAVEMGAAVEVLPVEAIAAATIRKLRNEGS